ncbi:FkbM family methyltransferase [Ekhidna sp.]
MRLKSKIKKALVRLTGYWFRKKRNLFTGVDLFYDIERTSDGPIEVIFDVGANKGQSVAYFKEEYKNARIYSFEPIKSLIPILEKNTKKYANVCIENTALGEVIGKQTINVYEDIECQSTLNSLDKELMNNDTNALEQDVEITTLDQYMRQNEIRQIDLLKIDVEKWEMQVLRGGLINLKDRKIRYILCEVGFSKFNRRHTDFIEVFDFLRNLNFCFIGIYELRLFDGRGHFGNALFKLNKEYHESE